jgi:hypothetical protein
MRRQRYGHFDSCIKERPNYLDRDDEVALVLEEVVSIDSHDTCLKRHRLNKPKGLGGRMTDLLPNSKA